MKYLFILALIFGIATSAMAVDISKCTKVIEKIGDNHVLVKYVLYDKDGKEVVVKTEEYGQERIDKEKEVAQAEYDKWNTFDVKKIEDSKVIAQEKITEVNKLQVEMNKVIKDKTIEEIEGLGN